MIDLQIIQSKIYEIRGFRVMLDFDLTEIYGIETRILKQSVRRNLSRFPTDFMFEVTKNEYNELKMRLRSQNVISNEERQRGGIRYMPFAFTELGVAMLSSVLNSETAISINIIIMRAFVAIRHLIINPPVNEMKELQNEVRELKQYVENVFTDYNDINEDTRMQLELINEALAELQSKNNWINRPRNPIGFITPED